MDAWKISFNGANTQGGDVSKLVNGYEPHCKGVFLCRVPRMENIERYNSGDPARRDCSSQLTATFSRIFDTICDNTGTGDTIVINCPYSDADISASSGGMVLESYYRGMGKLLRYARVLRIMTAYPPMDSADASDSQVPENKLYRDCLIVDKLASTRANVAMAWSDNIIDPQEWVCCVLAKWRLDMIVELMNVKVSDLCYTWTEVATLFRPGEIGNAKYISKPLRGLSRESFCDVVAWCIKNEDYQLAQEVLLRLFDKTNTLDVFDLVKPTGDANVMFVKSYLLARAILLGHNPSTEAKGVALRVNNILGNICASTNNELDTGLRLSRYIKYAK